MRKEDVDRYFKSGEIIDSIELNIDNWINLQVKENKHGRILNKSKRKVRRIEKKRS